jgi:hypothetical protein
MSAKKRTPSVIRAGSPIGASVALRRQPGCPISRDAAVIDALAEGRVLSRPASTSDSGASARGRHERHGQTRALPRTGSRQSESGNVQWPRRGPPFSQSVPIVPGRAIGVASAKRTSRLMAGRSVGRDAAGAGAWSPTAGRCPRPVRGRRRCRGGGARSRFREAGQNVARERCPIMRPPLRECQKRPIPGTSRAGATGLEPATSGVTERGSITQNPCKRAIRDPDGHRLVTALVLEPGLRVCPVV